MKRLLDSVMLALKSLARVGGYLLFILFLFSLLGVHHFKGTYRNRCRVTDFPINGTWEIDRSIKRMCTVQGYGDFICPEDRYCGNPDIYDLSLKSENYSEMSETYYGEISFDDIFSAMLLNFEVMVVENWGDFWFRTP